MRRLLIPVVMLAVVGSACGSGLDVGDQLPEPAVTITAGHVGGAPTAREAVQAWLSGLADGDHERVERVVYERQLTVLVAAEGYSADIVAGFLDNGLPETVQATFWDSFVEGVEGFSGRGIASLAAGRSAEFNSSGRLFATVAIEGGDPDQQVVATRDVEGRWWVDLVATFGAAFARPLNSWRASLGDGPDAGAAAAALAAQRTSLQVAVDLLPETNDTAESRAELRALIDALG